MSPRREMDGVMRRLWWNPGMRDSRWPARAGRLMRTSAGLALALFTLKENLLFSAPPAAPPAPHTTAVVVTAVQDLFVRPDETSSVDDQAILGDRVTVLEDAAGFAKVRTAAGEVAWIPERALRRRAGADAPAKQLAHVTSNFAHVYSSPSFTKQKPLLTAPVGV